MNCEMCDRIGAAARESELDAIGLGLIASMSDRYRHLPKGIDPTSPHSDFALATVRVLFNLDNKIRRPGKWTPTGCR